MTQPQIPVHGPAFVLLVEPAANAELANRYTVLAEELRADCQQVLNLDLHVSWLCLPGAVYRRGLDEAELERQSDALQATAQRLAAAGRTPLFLLPVCFDFGVQHKQWLTDVVRRLQRRLPGLSVHYDAMNAAHPLLIGALVDRAVQALADAQLRSPSELGLMLVAGGAGDPDTRADSYRVMRLVWEQLGASRGDVAFVRHTLHPLPEQLAACARSGLRWLLLPQFLWPTEAFEFAQMIYQDCNAQFDVRGSHLAAPLDPHPNLKGWLVQRMLELHRAQQSKLGARLVSSKHAATQPAVVHGPHTECRLEHWQAGDPATGYPGSVIAELSSAEELASLFARFGLRAERVVVKPTWHGYATGTFSDPHALGLLLSALPERAVVVEGHTSSRNDEQVDWDWEREAEQHRGWIHDQDQRYLEKTGLLDVLRRHRASYLNVTEAWWDDACAPAQAVLEHLERSGVTLQHEELASYVPSALFENRGLPLISFARFKGPTRASLSNLFGLLPQPLRAAWHGANITYFARVCCDLAKLYGALFELYAVVESLHVAVRWDRRGLYRSRWGNYDLSPRPGVVCLSRGLPAADVLAARLQGQDVRCSAFFDVVQQELGFDLALATDPIPNDLVRRFV